MLQTMLRENKHRIIARLIAFIVLITIVVICPSDRFSYALDHELDILSKDCTYTKYVQNRFDCIKSEYK